MNKIITLTANSTPEEFVETISKSIAKVIVDNREAFNPDNAAAVQELLDVLSLEDIKATIIDVMQMPVEPEVELPQEEPVEEAPAELPTEELEQEVQLSESDDSDLVPDDVMSLLED